MKKRIILWSLLLMFVLTVPVMASSVPPPLESACGFTPPEVAPAVTTAATPPIEAEELTKVPGPVKVVPPIVDKAGQPVTVERTNELIELAAKQEQNIQMLQLKIEYLNIILNKRSREIVDSELMYLQERTKVNLLQRQVQK